MEATVVLVGRNHLLAECPDYGADRIFVHRHDAAWEIADTFKGDTIFLEDVTENPGRGLRASRATWISRSKNLVAFTGTVIRVRHDRGFAFVAPDAGGKDIFCHAQDHLDYRAGHSNIFADLREGDRVGGFMDAEDPKPRGLRLKRI